MCGETDDFIKKSLDIKYSTLDLDLVINEITKYLRDNVLEGDGPDKVNEELKNCKQCLQEFKWLVWYIYTVVNDNWIHMTSLCRRILVIIYT